MNGRIYGLTPLSRDDNHAELSAPLDQSPKWIGIAQPLTPGVEGNARGIISDTSAGAQANGIRLGAFEIIEPELKIELAWVIFHERELCPPHWFVNPGGCAGFRICSHRAWQG